jgi:hypothetical protein
MWPRVCTTSNHFISRMVFGGAADCVLNRIFDALVGKSDQFKDLVDVIHLCSGHDEAPLANGGRQERLKS